MIRLLFSIVSLLFIIAFSPSQTTAPPVPQPTSVPTPAPTPAPTPLFYKSYASKASDQMSIQGDAWFDNGDGSWDIGNIFLSLFVVVFDFDRIYGSFS
jgi:hypothetical protein